MSLVNMYLMPSHFTATKTENFFFAIVDCTFKQSINIKGFGQKTVNEAENCLGFFYCVCIPFYCPFQMFK